MNPFYSQTYHAHEECPVKFVHVFKKLLIGIFLFSSGFGFGQASFMDEFNRKIYSHNDGTSNFSSSWIESDELGGDALTGKIFISDTGFLRLDELNLNTIYRNLDLTGATTVSLRVDYSSLSINNERLYIQLRNNVGAWETVHIINSPAANGNFMATLANKYVHPNAGIRFASSTTTWQPGEFVDIKSVNFTANIPLDNFLAEVKTPFNLRFGENIHGDFAFIANTTIGLDPVNPYDGEGGNSELITRFVDIDSDPTTFNSSSANYTNPEPSVTCLSHPKVFLYWAASNKEYGIDSNGYPTGTGGSEPVWNYDQVKVKLPGTSGYTLITADEVIYNGRNEHFQNDPVILFKDITDNVNVLPTPYGTYQIANVKGAEGQLFAHNPNPSNTGTSGGWQIVFVYQSEELDLRNISIFDGYAHVTKEQNIMDVEFNGFQTVPTGPVNADILFGVLEGDREISGDELQMYDTSGNWTRLTTAGRPSDNFFNSRIRVEDADFMDRLPASTNTLGFDAGKFQLRNTSNSLIDNNQTSATMRITSTQESYGMFLLGMSIEVFEPSLGAFQLSATGPTTNLTEGTIIPLTLDFKNHGNDDINNLSVSMGIPDQLNFLGVTNAPAGTVSNFDATTRLWTLQLPEGITDVNDSPYSINFEVEVSDTCVGCTTSTSIQAQANFLGDLNSNNITTLSSATLDSCGYGLHDPLLLSIQPNIWINNASAIEGNDMTFTITSNYILDTDIVLNLSYINGTTTNSDYSGPSSILFPAGSSSVDFNVAALDDNWVEATQQEFTVTIADTSGTTNIIDSDGIGTIIDTDQAYIIGDSYDIIEGGTVQYRLLLSNGNNSSGQQYVGIEDAYNVDIQFQEKNTSVSPATEGMDFNGFSTTVTFPANSMPGTEVIVSVNTTDDNIVEPSEEFEGIKSYDTAELTKYGSSPERVVIDAERDIIRIHDNDQATILLDNLTVNESVGSISYNFTLFGNVQNPFSFDFQTLDGSARASEDYNQNSGTINFSGNDGEVVTQPLVIIDDNVIENLEQFSILTDYNPTTELITNFQPQNIVFSPTTGNVDIVDNDSGPDRGVQFDLSNITVNEGDGTVALDVVLNIDVQEEFTIEFYTVDGSAIDGMDYNGIASGTQTLTFGGNNPKVQTINLVIIDDIAIESNEDFSVYLSNISSSTVNILDKDTAFVTIIDNDGNESWPKDITVEACETLPPAQDITSTGNCSINYVLEENITESSNACPTEYSITRTWTITDCVGNVRIHQQVVIIEDTIAPSFVGSLPLDSTVTCENVPSADVLTAMDSCEGNVTVSFNEIQTNNSNCNTGYQIIRTWEASDCAGNMNTHTQTITVIPNAPITSSPYQEETIIMCGEALPNVPNLTFTGGCGDYNIIFTEERQESTSSDDYMFVRTWEVTDACDAVAYFEQIIFVMQPQMETVTIEICIEEGPIDLLGHLPANFDTNGIFTPIKGDVQLSGSIFDPMQHQLEEYLVEYSSTAGECKYFMDFEIVVNNECVPCNLDDLIISKTITANGDGINDMFEIIGREFCDNTFDVMIFNRWGNKVFEANNYQNDWGGYSPDNAMGKSGYLPTGTYYYIITVVGTETKQLNGYIYVGTE